MLRLRSATISPDRRKLSPARVCWYLPFNEPRLNMTPPPIGGCAQIMVMLISFSHRDGQRDCFAVSLDYRGAEI